MCLPGSPRFQRCPTTQNKQASARVHQSQQWYEQPLWQKACDVSSANIRGELEETGR